MVRPASRWAPRPHSGVAGFPWNQWQLCYGISGNFRVEQVAALAWNRWQDSPGISGSFGVEYAHTGPGGPMARVRRAPPAAESSVAIRDGVAHITPPACVEAAHWARRRARASGA